MQEKGFTVKYIWMKQKGVLVKGKNKITFGEEFDASLISEAKAKRLLKSGAIANPKDVMVVDSKPEAKPKKADKKADKKKE